MNKKLLLIAGLAAVLITLAVAGVVSAQVITPETAPQGCGQMGNGYHGGMMNGYGPGTMMGNGFGRGGMMNGGYGPMHDAMFNALAEGLGLSREELDSRMAAGETPYQVALSLGLTQADFIQIMTDARALAIENAVAAGTLTQEQADWMTGHMGRFGGQCPYFSNAPAS